MHQCKEKCKLNIFTYDCKGEWILEYNHNEDHKCGIKIHHYKEYCYLKGKTSNCGDKCIYPYPHTNGEKEHNYGKTHYYIKKMWISRKIKRL